MRKLVLAAAAAAVLACGPSFAGDTAEDACYRHFDVNDEGQDFPEALKQCREAAEQGNSRAQYLLGYMLENGKGTEADPAGAFGWYMKSAARGYPSAEYVVGTFYLKGDVVRHDTLEAVKWLKRAAGHGQNDAWVSLSTIFAYGGGVRQDLADTVKLAHAVNFLKIGNFSF